MAKAVEIGFTRVTIINRQNYAPIAYSAPTDIATAWMDGKVQVNENQELLEWNKKDGKVKSTFCFYGKRFKLITSFDDDAGLVCVQGKEVLCAYRFNAAWFMAFTVIGGAAATKDAAKDAPKAKFGTAPKAFDTIFKEIWSDLVDAGW